MWGKNQILTSKGQKFREFLQTSTDTHKQKKYNIPKQISIFFNY